MVLIISEHTHVLWRTPASRNTLYPLSYFNVLDYHINCNPLLFLITCLLISLYALHGITIVDGVDNFRAHTRALANTCFAQHPISSIVLQCVGLSYKLQSSVISYNLSAY